METKICKTCGEEKILDEFYFQIMHTKTKGEYPLYRLSCKECVKRSTKKWIEDNQQRYETLIKERDSKNVAYHRELSRQRRLNGKYLKWSRENRDKTRKNSRYRALHKTHNISKTEWELCKVYFNNSCAYCGLPADQHIGSYRGVEKVHDLHKEHVNHLGSNDLNNCIPACKTCNCSKHTSSFEEWYLKQDFYSKEKYDKIIKWIKEDYKKCLDVFKDKKIS